MPQWLMPHGKVLSGDALNVFRGAYNLRHDYHLYPQRHRFNPSQRLL
jgi:hypothetical protein